MDRKVSGVQPLWPDKDRLTHNGALGKRSLIQFSDRIGSFNSLRVCCWTRIRPLAKPENVPRWAPNFATLPT